MKEIVILIQKMMEIAILILKKKVIVTQTQKRMGIEIWILKKMDSLRLMVIEMNSQN